MFGSFLGRFLGGDEATEEQHDPKLSFDGDEKNTEKPSPVHASPASTATPGGRATDSPLTALSSPNKDTGRPLGAIGAPPGLDDGQMRPVPPLPLGAKDTKSAETTAEKAATPGVLQVSLADALPTRENLRLDPSTPVVSLAAALPEPEEKCVDPSTPVVSLATALPEPDIGSEELPTLGSRFHRLGNCKPCAFLHTKGCKNGKECPFCHLCERGEKKRRQREKWQQKQVEYQLEQQSQVLSAAAATAAAAATLQMQFMPNPWVPPVLDSCLIDPTLFYMPTSPMGFGGTPVSLADALAAP